MLFYFSATGNTKHVTDEIRKKDEEVISIEDAVNMANYNFKIKDSRLGILVPTYIWGLPSIVYEFIEKALCFICWNFWYNYRSSFIKYR